jgi:uncharacterized membrane protein
MVTREAKCGSCDKIFDYSKYAAAIFVLFVAPLMAAGQRAGGNLSGVILDEMGARVARAKVFIVSASTRRELESDETGAFSVEVPEGNYQVLIKSPGFRVAKLNRVRVRSAASKEIKVILKVKPVKYGKCPKGQTCIWL